MTINGINDRHWKFTCAIISRHKDIIRGRCRGMSFIRYLELIEFICLIMSIGNFIAIGFAWKKKRQIFKTMYFINILGVVIISNLIIWLEGWYVDENNLSGSIVSFFLNVCNTILFIVNSIVMIGCRKVYDRSV